MSVLPSRLSSLISFSQLPEQLHAVNANLTAMLEKVYYQNYTSQLTSDSGDFYAQLDIISFTLLKFTLPGTEFALLLNPDTTNPNQTSFPLALSYSLGIRQYVPDFTLLDVLSNSPEAYFPLLLAVAQLPERALLRSIINSFIPESDQPGGPTRYQKFATQNNLAVGPLNPDPELALDQLLAAYAVGTSTVAGRLFTRYLTDSDEDKAFDNLKALFTQFVGVDPLKLIRDLTTPNITAATYLSAAIEFPRSLLLPVKEVVDAQGNITYVVEPESTTPTTPTVKARVIFKAGDFTFSTQGGFGYDGEVEASLPASHPRVQIGNTGLQVSFARAKLDLSDQTNIAEAQADARPADFKGLYVGNAAVFLPETFKTQGTPTIQANQLLIGTGGVSGTISAFSTVPGNGNGTQASPLISATLFKDVKIDFYAFEVTFSQNQVVYSNLTGTFTFDTLKRADGSPAKFAFDLLFSEDGYRLAFESVTTPVSVTLGSLAVLHFTKLAIGKKGSDWYLDVAADVEVTQALPIIGKALPSKIVISQLLIHSDPASVAITALPTWDDGTQLTVNPRDGFSLSKTLNLAILNILKVEKLRLSTHKDPDGTLQTLATFDATLGLTSDSTAAAPAGDNTPPPGFHARIINAGFTAALKPTPDGTGNLALANIQLGVKLPDSVGVSVNAGGLVGAGTLAILDNGNRYEGVLALAFRDKINLAAYGILTKNLPGGGDGPSLLALITAQFRAIELGLGFTLNAVGGLLGLHRAADTDNLRGLVRTGQLDKLLFPSPATASLAELTATLAVIDAAFPATSGRYLIGLMARLGWGTPKTLITLDVALLVELPSPVRVVILGVLKTSLPSEQNDTLKLRADFLGTVDFGSKQAAFDATLSDSHILAFALTGDLAFRFYQGNNPLFVITAGGFHPAFQPPAGAGLAGLRRLTLSLSRGDDLRVTLTSYFAVTSNTVQFGSHLELYYRIARGLHVEGYFGFDVLFQFNPFHVQAHVEAGVAIKYGSRELLSLHLSLDVTGPGPWHLWGSASFKVWFVRIHVDVDAYIGSGQQQPALPATDVETLLVAALNAAASWEVEAPKTAMPGGVVLRPVGTTTAQFFLDPRGALVLRQRVVPLGVALGKYGAGPIAPTTGRRFDLTALVVGGTPHPVATDKNVEKVRDFFAPDQFQPLTDAQKLSLPSFQLLPCGLRLASLAGLVADDKATLRVVEYEHKFLSGASGGAATTPPPKMSARGYQQLVRGGALGQEVEAARPSARAPQPLNWAEDAYVVVHAATLELYDPVGHARFATQVEAEQYRQGLVTATPVLAGEVLVVPEYQLELA